jgi:hypothetical protein
MQMQQIRPITLAPAQEVEFIYTSPKASKQHPKQGGASTSTASDFDALFRPKAQ